MKLIMLFKRKPSLTPTQFREHYEQRHVPLALGLLPFFKEYSRNYVRHDLDYRVGHTEVAKAGPEFDVATEISFASKDDYDQMMRALADPAILGQIVEDEERFMDRSATAVFFVEEERTPPAKLREFNKSGIRTNPILGRGG